jgi:hypothetical protein
MRFARREKAPGTGRNTRANVRRTQRLTRRTTMTSPWVAGLTTRLRRDLAMCNNRTNVDMSTEPRETLTTTWRTEQGMLRTARAILSSPAIPPNRRKHHLRQSIVTPRNPRLALLSTRATLISLPRRISTRSLRRRSLIPTRPSLRSSTLRRHRKTRARACPGLTARATQINRNTMPGW